MKNMINFSVEELDTYIGAKEILEAQSNNLKLVTEDLVYGVVREYEGIIESYTSQGILKSVTDVKNLMGERFISVQNNLGELEEHCFTYEFYITSQWTKNYKYRVMFLRHGIARYPLKIVIDQDIADELEVASEMQFEQEQEFISILERIFQSNKFKEIVQNLYTFNKKDALEFF